MVYSGGFVGCILVNGQVQAERADGIVIIPEGTEYAIRLRNKNDRRAVGQIFIDGENVSGGGYVINQHNYVDIYRFSDKDEAFRVVGLNSPEAVDAGKNGPNDGTKGVIELRFRLEVERPRVQHVNTTRYRNTPKIKPWGGKRDGSDELLRGASYSTQKEETTKGFLNFDGDRVSRSLSAPMKDAVTVGGSSTGQRFSMTTLDLETNVVVLKIVLKTGEPVVKLTYCPNCGHKVGKQDKFCASCGHRLISSR